MTTYVMGLRQIMSSKSGPCAEGVINIAVSDKYGNIVIYQPRAKNGPTLSQYWAHIRYVDSILLQCFLQCISFAAQGMNIALQSQKAVTAYFSSKQLLSFGFAWQSSRVENHV